MTNGEAVNWLINISADVGKAEHRDLWHYEQALMEIREMLESAQPEQRWIPCRVKPTKNGIYAVWTEKGFGDHLSTAYYSTIDGWTLRIVAWMPIEPWRGEEHERMDV